jgi:hypothetical protein
MTKLRFGNIFGATKVQRYKRVVIQDKPILDQ